MKLTFKPANIVCDVTEGRNILEIAKENGINIDGNCSGNGTCGKCKVEIISGDIGFIDELSNKHINHGDDKYVLACKTIITNDTVIRVPEEDSVVKRKTDLLKMPESFYVDSRFKIATETFRKLNIERNESLYKYFVRKFNLSERNIPVELVKKMSFVKENDIVSCIKYEDSLIDFRLGLIDNIFGVSVDIGTTTVVVMLWNLENGKLIESEAFTNPQGNYGADVISRINFCDGEYSKVEELQNIVISQINSTIKKLTKSNGISEDDIYKMIVVGNTTMSHLILGINPEKLAISPFVSSFEGATFTNSYNLGFLINKNAVLEVAPNIAGHVGSDITAGILTTSMMKDKKYQLFIDIGTNGEIVISGDGKLATCSTAAGPAFEGSSIVCGMRAANGAIEEIVIDKENVSIKTIGNKLPIGICGSGIIDAVGELVKNGIVNKMGKLLTKDKLISLGFSESVANRSICDEDGSNHRFLLYKSDDREIYISQKDIREIQMAKAAIFAGEVILMKHLGIDKNELSTVNIAGAFGNYIKKHSAINAGLIPRVEENKIKYLGNSAGIGASMMLLSQEYDEMASEIVKKIQHIELATEADFQNEYLTAMKFI